MPKVKIQLSPPPVPFKIQTAAEDLSEKQDNTWRVCSSLDCMGCHHHSDCRWCLADHSCHSKKGTCEKWSYERAYIGCQSRETAVPTTSPTAVPTLSEEDIRKIEAEKKLAEANQIGLGDKEEQLGRCRSCYSFFSSVHNHFVRRGCSTQNGI